MSFNRQQLLAFTSYRNLVDWFCSRSTKPASPEEQDDESNKHDAAKKDPPEHMAVSNEREPEPPETRSELLSVRSSSDPRLRKRKRPSDAFEETTELKRRLGRRDEVIAQLRFREAELKADMAKLQGYFEEERELLVREKDDQEERLQVLQAEMDTKVRRLTEEKRDCEEQLKKAQESAFRQMKVGKWEPRDDSSIRSDLQKLGGKIRAWSRTQSSMDLQCFNSLSPKEISQVENMLHKGICASTETLCTAINHWPVRHNVPMLLVHAVIAKIMFDEIFNRPFYLFNKNRSMRGENLICQAPYSPSFETDLERLYARMRHAGHQDSHVWRSQTLRLLHDPKNDPRLEEELEEMSTAVYKALANRVMDGPVFNLCRKVNPEDQEKRKQDLIDLFADAGKLAQELWTQRTYMEIIDKQGLGKFQVDSPKMVAHRLQKLDEDDHRFDGHEIMAVIQPALVAYGNDDGENYDNHKVWSKAIVLVAE